MKRKTFNSTELTILYTKSNKGEVYYENFKDDISEENFNNLMEYEMEFPETDTGTFDSEKGAIYDFEVIIYHGELEYVGKGGYYTNQGTEFNNDIDFELKVPDFKENNNMYLKLTCYDYKGGELGHPKLNKSLEKLITHTHDLYYKIEKNGNIDLLSNEEIINNFWKWLSEHLENIYAGGGEVNEFYIIKGEELTKLEIKDIIEISDSELLLKLIKDEE